MEEIIKVLLQEGIDEGMINKVLDLIEEEYEVVENIRDYSKKKLYDTMDKYYATKDPIKRLELDDEWSDKSKLADKAEEIFNKAQDEKGTKELTKNISGDIHTDIRRKDSFMGTRARRHEDEKAGHPKAIKKSVERHYKKK